MARIVSSDIIRDLDDILKIERRCFVQGFSGSVFFFFYEAAPDLLKIVQSDAGSIIGYCLGLPSGRILDRGWIISIAVLPEYRRMGFGSALLTEVTNRLRKQVAEVCLTVKVDNKVGISFYLKNSFRIVSTESDMFGDGCPRHIMVRQCGANYA